jgi:ferredoxin
MRGNERKKMSENKNFNIFYFTGTGNTLLLAKDLQSEIRERGFDAEIFNMENYEKKNDPIIGENIILMFPVYAYGPPKIVTRFINKIDSSVEKVSLVLNYGLLAVNTYKITAKLLRNKGIRVDYCAGLRMPANYINLYNPPKLKTALQRVDRAEKKLKNIAEDILNGSTNKIKKGMFFLRIPMRIVYSLFLRNADWMGSMFYADDTCSKCGQCLRCCPVLNISMEKDSKPVWNGRCEQCVRCIHICPEKAIQWGLVTRNRRRYINTKIPREELLNN